MLTCVSNFAGPLAVSAWSRKSRIGLWQRVLLGVLCLGYTLAVHVAKAAPSGQDPIALKNAVVSLQGSMPIPAHIYGVNNLWKNVSDAEFGQFANAMSKHAHYTLIRFPGGWEAEHYDWKTNRTPGWEKSPDVPGVDPDTLILKSPSQSFVVRTSPAMKENSESSRVELAKEAAGLVKRYGKNVKIWEIGNEWWLQGFAHGEKRAEGLRRYAKVVAHIAPAMKKVDPSINIYVNGDWTQPEEFAALRNLVGKDIWSIVDGLSVHLYCGQMSDDSQISFIRTRLNQIKAVTRKDKLYASEWNVSLRASGMGGLRNANVRAHMIQEMLFGGVTAAAIWPPVKVLPRLALVTPDYTAPLASGQGFGWMAESYRGMALSTSGDVPLVAAQNISGKIVVIVPSMGEEVTRIRVKIPDIAWKSVVSSEVMYDRDDPDKGPATIADLPVVLQTEGGMQTFEFILNPGGKGRGNSWEMARIILK